METTVNITCTNCGTVNSAQLDQVLVNNFQNQVKQELQEEFHLRQQELDEQKKEYSILFSELSKEKEGVDQLVQDRVKTLLQTRETNLKESIRKQIDEEKSLQLQELEDELIKKSGQIRELHQSHTKLEQLRRDMSERETQLILDKEKEYTQRLEEARLSIKEQTQQESFLKLKEREKVIKDLTLKLEEAKRRAEQGSMQLQGDIQEISIVEMLQEFHPYDEITQSKKGVNAADILHIVRTHNAIECGRIYYESKRTKNWSNEWIKKFKQDNINTKADIMVLVTNALPKGIERYGIVDGVWVCSFKDVKELSLVLRYGLLKVQQVAIIQQGKDSKMELLYNYLTSEDFKSVFESIIEGFRTIQENHAAEKLKMQRLWKEREKILERVLSNSIEFYGSIKGIAGASIPEIKMLDYKKAS